LLLSTIWLLMTPESEAKKPVEPVAYADLHVTAPDGAVDVVLTGGPPAVGRTLGADPNVHVDEITTVLTPHLAKGAGAVAELTGYRLSRVNDPGDTIVTYVLLLETAPGSRDVKALWWENHQEVPTRLYTGDGKLGDKKGGAHSLALTVTDAEGTQLVVEGVVRLP
jgi:hypothetical protein